jgi:hypothetical protein
MFHLKPLQFRVQLTWRELSFPGGGGAQAGHLRLEPRTVRKRDPSRGRLFRRLGPPQMSREPRA